MRQGRVYVLGGYAAAHAEVVRVKIDAQLRLPSDVSGLRNGPGLANLTGAYALTVGLSLQLLLAHGSRSGYRKL